MSALRRQEAEESIVGLQRGGADGGTRARALGRLFVLSPRELSAQRPLVPDACETVKKNKKDIHRKERIDRKERAAVIMPKNGPYSP